MSDLMAQRAALRKQLRQARRQLTPEQQTDFSLELSLKLQQDPRIQQAQTLAYYLANDGEIDLTPFTQWAWQHGKTLCLPVLHPFSKGHLLFLHYHPGTELVPNSFGIPEPELSVLDVVPIAQIDAILLPLVGFDPQANRLGMGGGFYDRTLAQWHQQRHPMTTLIGVAHECQKVAQLPIAPWDVPLDEIITPISTYRNSQTL